MSQNRHCYLIDTENAGYGWINRLPPLNRSDRVVLFYSNNSLRDKSLALAESGGILEQMSLYRCENGGKNAMDYHILFWVAQESCLAPEMKYAIISNDADYDIALAPFLKHGIIIRGCLLKNRGQQPLKKCECCIYSIKEGLTDAPETYPSKPEHERIPVRFAGISIL